MTDNTTNTRIAEAIPRERRWWSHWSHGDAIFADECDHCDGAGACGSEQDSRRCPFCEGTGRGEERYVGPDFTGDLNAMHMAEKVLTPDRQVWYETNLLVAMGKPFGAVWYATAAQRAEAFLRTLNLWEG